MHFNLSTGSKSGFWFGFNMTLTCCVYYLDKIVHMTLDTPSLDPRPSDLCILMEGLVRDDHVA